VSGGTSRFKLCMGDVAPHHDIFVASRSFPA
jgi:hypothetical protein